jgi:hypothetical protein
MPRRVGPAAAGPALAVSLVLLLALPRESMRCARAQHMDLHLCKRPSAHGAANWAPPAVRRGAAQFVDNAGRTVLQQGCNQASALSHMRDAPPRASISRVLSASAHYSRTHPRRSQCGSSAAAATRRPVSMTRTLARAVQPAPTARRSTSGVRALWLRLHIRLASPAVTRGGHQRVCSGQDILWCGPHLAAGTGSACLRRQLTPRPQRQPGAARWAGLRC